MITTLTTGSSLRLALPELVGRIGRYFRAQVGLVALHNPENASLEVVSPIWTAGYSLEIDRYILPLTGSGEIEQTFVSETAALYHDMTGDPDAHSILGELGARSAMCVPLRVENRTIGVLVLADKEENDFDTQDLDALTSLSGPAALVVAQLERIEEAAQSTRRMEELARMKSDFVSVVSHELRTPLTSIIGSLATLSRSELAPATKQGRELLASARTQGDRLRRLIEDLLTASRLEHGGLPRTPAEIDLRAFLREVVQTIPTEGRRISIDVQEGAEYIVADSDHLSRIIINLVDNALKYAGSSPIEIVSARKGKRLVLSIIDHGSGIQLQEQEHAFERFTQLEPAQTRSQGGAGLGLSIVNGLVKGMGGTLELRETPGGGASFIVELSTGIVSDPGDLVTQTPLR
ncbi:MAG: ATP-binding protein [Acidimicrobiia bacterium]